MTQVEPNRHSQVWVWILIGLLALLLALFVFFRVAQGEPIQLAQGNGPQVGAYATAAMDEFDSCLEPWAMTSERTLECGDSWNSRSDQMGGLKSTRMESIRRPVCILS